MKQLKNLTKQLGGGQLSDLEHFIAYDAQADKIHVKPLPSYFIVTTNIDGVKINKRTDSNSSYETIQLINGKNKCIGYNFGFYFNNSGNKVISFDLNNYNTSEIVNMTYMFYSCSNLTSLDLSNFNTANVTSMYGMFHNCDSLVELDLSSFDTSNVTSMDNMFNNCRSLTSLDLSSFDTSKVTRMESMFSNCKTLTSLDISNVDTSNVTDMSSMFIRCSNLSSLDLSNFDTSNVTDMTYMFYGCTKLSKIKCKQAFKDWCLNHQDTIKLPTAMRDGGNGNWEIVDLS